MNKSELQEALAKELNLSLQTTTSIVATILDSMTDALVRGENVEIRGFGSFTVRQYDAYTGKNPKTGEKTRVKAKKLPFFKVGKELREAVDAGRPKE
ncbi:MAG: integration host factor subunit beta [Proteobacteria bacterium]|nr:integration host factor subunit beta [Pseudomonadota bacterium]MBU1058616.1 integration host factor subunit beta [Pseudomonadota bacterium]